MHNDSSPLRARKLLSHNIRSTRKEQNLSQEELAARAGIHRTYLGAIERAEQNVSIDNIERIAVALGCTVAYLLREDSA